MDFGFGNKFNNVLKVSRSNFYIMIGDAMNFSVFIFISLAANLLFADTLRLNRTTIMKKTYSCSNGGTIVLQNTRFGNVKKVVFSKPGQPSQYNYVKFWNMTDYYEGNMVSWIKIPNRPEPITDDLLEGRTTADMTIHDDGNKFIMTITPIRTSYTKFSCEGL